MTLDEELKEIKHQMIKELFIKSDGGISSSEQMIDGTWYTPRWGCDTMDMIIEFYAAHIRCLMEEKDKLQEIRQPNQQSPAELRKSIEKALEIEWAIDNVMGKPDRVEIVGYPKGGYHLSYSDFIERIRLLIEKGGHP